MNIRGLPNGVRWDVPGTSNGKMLFKPEKDVKMIEGELIYTKDDFSFDFEPNKSADYSVLIGYINITFDSITKTARQIWGCNPYQSWEKKALGVPIARQSGLSIDEKIESGDVFRLVEAGEWRTYFDESNGWICIGNNLISTSDNVIEFARNTVIVLCNCKIKALWLKPKFL